MRYELILGGTLLLTAALTAKIVWDLPVLERVAQSLNALWAVLAAFHFWPQAYGWVSTQEWLPADAGSFWGAFLVAALPGVLLGRRLLRGLQIDFPGFFDWVTGFLFSGLLVCLLPCLIVMTASLVPAVQEGQILPGTGIPGQIASTMRRLPVEGYLRVAVATGGERAPDLIATRLPRALRQQLYPRGLER